MIKIKGNKDLFEQIQTLSQRIMAQASYVQSDCDLTQDDIKEFIRMNDSHTKELAEVKQIMLAHIVECNKDSNG